MTTEPSTPSQHRREALRLIAKARTMWLDNRAMRVLAEAQVHATLALAPEDTP